MCDERGRACSRATVPNLVPSVCVQVAEARWRHATFEAAAAYPLNAFEDGIRILHVELIFTSSCGKTTSI